MPSSSTQTPVLTAQAARSRAILRGDMVACKLAFIDCKLPGSDLKENYSLIGPGVTQSDDQFVNLTEPHGFSVGVAAMPPGTTNNLHLHFTAEVFMVQKGRWRFRWGDGKRQGEIEGGPGDVLSIPTWIFRGFSNIGDDTGWIITALGGDETGGIIWHPSILSAAAEHGLYLTRDNMLVDVAGGATKPGAEALMQPLSSNDMGELRWWTEDEMRRRVLPAGNRDWSSTALLGGFTPGSGCELAPVIGYGLSEQRGHLASIAGAHGFSLDWLRLAPGGSTGRFLLRDKQVLSVTQGSVDIVVNTGADAVTLRLQEQDVYAMPAGVWREVRAAGPHGAELTLTTSGDDRKRVVWSDEVAEAAQLAGVALDPDGCIAPLRLLPRSAIGVGVSA
jgi:quercetin dioxygenase-like cupin family protein